MKKFNQTFAGLLVLTVAAGATATLKAQTQNPAPLKLAQTVTLPGYTGDSTTSPSTASATASCSPPKTTLPSRSSISPPASTCAPSTASTHPTPSSSGLEHPPSSSPTAANP
jgi:hypothetical protein